MGRNHFISLENKEELLYIVAVSGGADSTFLLYKMYSLGYKIIAAHVNYGKRHDSSCDEKLITEHCQKLSIRLFTERVVSYRKGNFQAIARNLRYKFFLQIAEKLSSEGSKIGGIVIAHNFEDLLETYQLQKERESLVNYWGLPIRSWFGKWPVLRPLINFRKEWIVKFLTWARIRYSIDYTNNTTIYRRNVIRKMIFALSEKEKNLLAEQIEKENISLLQSITEVNKKIKVLFKENTLQISNEEWLLSENEIKQRIIYVLLNNFSKGKFLSHKKKLVAEVCKQLQSKKEKLFINLGSKLRIAKLGKVAIFEKVEGYKELQ